MAAFLDFALFFAIGFGVMEPTSYLLHRFVFHGPLWVLHRSHHEPSAGGRSKWRFEANDSFGLFFAAIAIVCMSVARRPIFASPLYAFACGVTAFGFSYSAVHDVVIHRRFFSFGTKWKLFDRIREAHRYHHRSVEKDAHGPYGLFWVWDYRTARVERR